MLSNVDREVISEMSARDARSHFLADRVCRALGIGLLSEGLRRSGRFAGQLKVGPLTILCVRLDRRDRPLESECP